MTDWLDAKVLAHFGEAMRLSIGPLRDDDTQACPAVMACRRQVLDMLVAEKNRLGVQLERYFPESSHISVGLSRS